MQKTAPFHSLYIACIVWYLCSLCTTPISSVVHFIILSQLSKEVISACLHEGSLLNTGPVCNETDIRLVNGTNPASGTLEICLGGRWGLVCSDSWDANDAAVICRQLGFPTTSLSFYCVWVISLLLQQSHPLLHAIIQLDEALRAICYVEMTSSQISHLLYVNNTAEAED